MSLFLFGYGFEAIDSAMVQTRFTGFLFIPTSTEKSERYRTGLIKSYTEIIISHGSHRSRVDVRPLKSNTVYSGLVLDKMRPGSLQIC